MPPRKLYFENLRIGDELPAMAKAPIDRVQLARYAAATNDYNPLNIDELQAKAIGMPSVVAPSTLGLGFLGQLVTDWARGGQVRRASARFTRMLWPGDTLVCKGRVSDRWGEGGRYFVELDVWAENQKGELVVRGTVALKVFYSFEDETRFRTGQPPLIVNVPRESLLHAPPAPAPAPSSTASKPPKGKPAASKKPAKKATRSAPKKKAAPKKPAKPKKTGARKPAKSSKRKK
ncbi:MAG: MaoC family dehydratase N-terminal domain-containing protein [Myxococcaceae bacterium]|nr:MaoC family dehydratase N-terminal domain-containing protein [Myxococcaceae bacterium]